MKKSLCVMKKGWLALFSAALFAALVMSAADMKAADTTAANVTAIDPWDAGKQETYIDGPLTYYIHPSKNGQEAWVYRIKATKEKIRKDLTIPAEILGKKVTRLGCTMNSMEDEELDEESRYEYNEAYATLFGMYVEPWHNWDTAGLNYEVVVKAAKTILSIQIPDTVEAIDPAAFAGLDSLKEIRIPQKVKEIRESTFYGCDKLKTVTLPEQLESFDNSALEACPSLKTIKLSKNCKAFQVKKNCLIRKKDKALVFAAATGKKFKIPDGVKKITSYSFGNASSKTVQIPASVTRIEGKAFNVSYMKENAKIKDVTVSKKNRTFARDGQCIYKKSDKSLAVAIPDKRGNLRISEKVKKLTPDISLVNCDTTQPDYEGVDLKKVVFPSKLKRVTAPAFGAFEAKKIYFTGKNPPKIVVPDNDEAYYHRLPIFCHIYVPKASLKKYKKLYKKHDCYRSVDGWHTYNP